MNRREFLAGVFGTAAVAAMPIIPALAKSVINADAWMIALGKVFEEYYIEAILYGTAGITSTDEFPFIRVVRAQELYSMIELDRACGKTGLWTTLNSEPL